MSFPSIDSSDVMIVHYSMHENFHEVIYLKMCQVNIAGGLILKYKLIIVDRMIYLPVIDLVHLLRCWILMNIGSL